MLVLVTLDALGRVGQVAVLEPPGSVEARVGAEHPGEAVHLVGAVAALAIAASGLIGLLVRPRFAGFATQAAAAALGAIAVVLVMGDPDNYGGQAGPVDLAFLVMTLPALAAALTAVPWRQWRRGGVARPRLLVLAVLGLPAVAFGVQQALVQRRTWPPLADPHHQSHWYAMAVLGLIAVPVVAGAAFAGRGWRTGTTTVGLAAVAVAVTSLVAPAAGSALHPVWAIAALLWGLSLLAATFTPSRKPA